MKHRSEIADELERRRQRFEKGIAGRKREIVKLEAALVAPGGLLAHEAASIQQRLDHERMMVQADQAHLDSINASLAAERAKFRELRHRTD